MSVEPSKSRLLVCAASIAALLTGCGGDGAGRSQSLGQTVAAPIPMLNLSGNEDTSVEGILIAPDPKQQGAQFSVASAPKHGEITLDAPTGTFTYTPHADYNGSDSFSYRMSKPRKSKAVYGVTINLAAVNDAPVFSAIPDMMNSAETHDTVLNLPVSDVDGDVLHVVATSDNLQVASVAANDTARALTLSPSDRGNAGIHVTVSDGEFSFSRDFVFTVGDVLKLRDVDTRLDDGDAITFTNTTDKSVDITFHHNGFPLFQSDEEIVRYVATMPDQFVGERFERKLWRFVRGNTYHFVPLTPKQWLHDTWAVVNAQGWGICSHVSAAYVSLARAAGFEARVWGLTGHVVPEIKVNGQWQMFDPDLGTYYFTPDLRIANVADIASDPSLILAPINRLLPESFTYEYSSKFADVYGSANDNFIGDSIFIARESGRYQPLVLPPGARLTYPGKWTESVIGFDDTTPYNVPYYLQSELVTSAGWTGKVILPWMLWEVRGTGRVRVLDQEFDIGSPALTALIQDPGRQIPDIEVLSASSDLSFISFINAMRYELIENNKVALTGVDVWAVAVGTRQLLENERPNPARAAGFRKPAF
jgi:Big-like domain-containing protein/transglutaminase superfamily protein